LLNRSTLSATGLEKNDPKPYGKTGLESKSGLGETGLYDFFETGFNLKT